MKRAIILLLSASFFGGCGETVEPAEGSQTVGGFPQKLAELPQGGEIPFHLVVSNQSFDTNPVLIEIYVDGSRVITGDFEVMGQHSFHNFDFTTTPGTHHVRAVTIDGIQIEEDVQLTAEMWGIITFWHYATDEYAAGPTPRSLNWSTRDTEPVWN